MGLKIKRGTRWSQGPPARRRQAQRVERVIPKKNRVVVGGVNERTRHARPSQNNQQGLFTRRPGIDIP